MVDDGVDGRRTDTKERIRDVALDVFIERGWEGATLREIAEHLGITRPALYYHFASKEAILDSIHEELAATVDPITAWARVQSNDGTSRAEVLDRLSSLISGSWGPFMRFAQRDEGAMRTLRGAAKFVRSMEELVGVLCAEDSVAARIRARLALDAIFMADSRTEHLGGTARMRRETALRIAKSLVA